VVTDLVVVLEAQHKMAQIIQAVAAEAKVTRDFLELVVLV
jgi:hypothetical protein